MDDIKDFDGILVSKSEPTSLVTHIANKGVPWKRFDLKVGDYLIGNRVYERKELNNFLQSFYSKQLFKQVKNMMQYEYPFLILEGVPPTGMTPASFYELKSLYVKLIGYHIGFNLSIIHTPSERATALWLVLTWKKMTAVKKDKTPVLHNRIPMGETLGETRMLMLTAIPGIGKKSADSILKAVGPGESHGTLSDVGSVPEEILRDIKIGNRKLGTKLAKRVKGVFNWMLPYNTKID